MERVGVEFHQLFFTIIGVNGIPLSYVVQKYDKPDANGDFPNFIDNMITCAPFMVDYYEADCCEFQQALVPLKTGQP